MLSIDIQRRLLISTSFILLAMTSGFAVVKFLYVGSAHLPLAAMAMSIVLIANIVYIYFGGNLVMSQMLALISMVLGFVFAVVISGGFNSAPVLIAPVLPMVAILWFDNRAGWIVAGSMILILVALLLAEINGLVPPNPQTIDGQRIAHFVVASIVTPVCTWLSWSFAQVKKHHIDSNRHDAATDHLTNLANRRAIDEALLREVGRAKRDKGWFSFALIDVDLFKRYNDSRGHQAGDECLIQIAQEIASVTKRPSDVAGRFGGEEFAMILPDTKPEGAFHLAKTLRKKIEGLNLAYTEDSGEIVTITIGVISIAGAEISSIEDLIKEADSALYRGKSNGRNQVVMKTIDTLL